jgi:predicted RND superfamily exporter protein
MERGQPGLERLFARVVALRWPIVAFYLLLLPMALRLALSVPVDHSIARMIVASDPDHLATREFQRLFPERTRVLLLLEAEDPLAPGVLERLRGLEAALSRIPRVAPVSPVTIAERLRPGLTDPTRNAELREFLLGTRFFQRIGLLGGGFVGVAVTLDVEGARQRDAAIEQIERASLDAQTEPVRRVRRIGEAFVEAWLERETRTASARYLPLFGLFVVALVFFLYRSWRTLLAVLLTLAVCVLLGVAAAGLLGFSSSIVSALVPLTLMVTATASLVYLQSRYVDCPAGSDPQAHQLFALANKFTAVSVSIFAAAAGFAALGVSHIRPIREMGLWTATGLVATWLVCFTLFPALQRLLRTPTGRDRSAAGSWMPRLAEVLPRFSYRYRYLLVLGAAGLSAAGAVAVFGWRDRVAAMPLQVDSLDYVDPRLPLHDDIRAFERQVSGLTSFALWIETPPGRVLEPGFLGALDRFAQAVEAEPRVGAVSGITTILRLRRYAAGLGERLPEDPAELRRMAADLEQLLLLEPALREFVDVNTLGATRLDVLTRAGGRVRIAELGPILLRLWAEAQGREAALAGCRLRVVGQGLLTEKIAQHLVPTLVQSFVLTAGLIFVAFLLVFRSGAARLLAMVPSLFAILVMFLLMRLLGVPLNVATILIATTVLGASENDQVHFFYHFQERRRTAGTEEALAHAIRVAGSAIFFATVVNAGGFLALALSPLPPMRQFGILSSSAFALSMLADFTALPAALWIVFRERPDSAPE